MEGLKQVLRLLLLPFWYCAESLFRNCLDFLVPASWRKAKDLSGEVVLVTGGGAGLGRSLAAQLAQLGAVVVTWDVDGRGNAGTARAIRDGGGEVRAYTVDVGDAEDVYAAAERVRDEVGAVTMLVNNAAIGQARPIGELPDELVRKMMTTNATAHFWLLKAFLPSMKANNHGHIVTVLSGSVNLVPVGLGAYIASKIAALGLHQATRVDLAFERKTGVHTTAAFLDFVATDMTVGRINCGTARVLQPEEAARQIIEAIRINLPIFTPSRLSLICYLFKSFIPTKLFFLLFELGGVTSVFPSRTADGKAKAN